MSSLLAYYARPMGMYDTALESHDIKHLAGLGYELIQFRTPEIQARAKTEGMAPFKPLVQKADVLFFRAYPDGKIGAGVAKEIQWANEKRIPIFEIPWAPAKAHERYLDIETTRKHNSRLEKALELATNFVMDPHGTLTKNQPN